MHNLTVSIDFVDLCSIDVPYHEAMTFHVLTSEIEFEHNRLFSFVSNSNGTQNLIKIFFPTFRFRLTVKLRSANMWRAALLALELMLVCSSPTTHTKFKTKENRVDVTFYITTYKNNMQKNIKQYLI